jgi:mono/diheme cytochrome c family protein
MKKVGNHNSISRKIILSLALLRTFSFTLLSQATQPAAATPATATATAAPTATIGGDAVAGKALFNANCAACHALDKKMTGPALRGVSAKYDKPWLYKWINNSSAMVKSGDAKAVKIYEEFNKSVMTSFPNLSTADIDNIIAYTDEPKAEPVAPVGVAAVPGTAGGSNDISNDVVLGALSLVLLMLVVMLFFVNNVLTKVAKMNGVEVPEKEKTTPIWKAFAKNQFLVLVSSIFLLLSSGYFVYGYLMQIGVDQDYAPIQPIHYSHRIHAGSNGIDCKYCHSSARVSKHAGIPSLNVCMNCHKSIAEVSDTTATPEYSKAFYDGEIKKLYNAVGWDQENQKYTGKTSPVKWVRIHNLPDFAYFNHSQHVSVAGVECQTCHGPIESMEEVYQYSPLTMKWCVDCHRTTEVNTDNKYYDQLIEAHEKLKKGEKMTAAMIGGLECGKCHY